MRKVQFPPYGLARIINDPNPRERISGPLLWMKEECPFCSVGDPEEDLCDICRWKRLVKAVQANQIIYNRKLFRLEWKSPDLQKLKIQYNMRS